MSGIVFFMLIGRWFQLKTQHAVSFERDYSSYFPLSTVVIVNNEKKYLTIDKIVENDIILVRNHELIPADAVLKKGKAIIDYSFVTGENEPVHVGEGEVIYAGGKQLGTGIELKVVRPVSSSHLTNLWNNDAFHNKKNKEISFIHPWSNYFSIALFSVAIAAGIYWQMNAPEKTWKAITSILIVACPCSLLLSATFTYGNLMRIFGKNNLFLKNANVIERIGEADTIIFDKTGTLTTGKQSTIKYQGKVLSYQEAMMLKSISSQSIHPLSKTLTDWEDWSKIHDSYTISSYHEVPGKGIEATIENNVIKMGNAQFVKPHPAINTHQHAEGSVIYISINDIYKGCFMLNQHYRPGIFEAIHQLKTTIKSMHVLSGDNNREEENIRIHIGKEAFLGFEKTPQEKLNYIKILQQQGKKVIMFGDGLNDAGALQQSDVGIAVTDSSNYFTPACDAIISGDAMGNIDKLLKLAKAGKKIVTFSFLLSIGYNIIGLSFATKAMLSPLIAAILMPASSISIILLVTLLGNLYTRMHGLKFLV
jgi:Cu+-exporting ATPase